VTGDRAAAGVARTCALEMCHDSAVDLIDHPYRPESETALCAHHADIVRAEVDAEVIDGV
jgi:hypothetical protein